MTSIRLGRPLLGADPARPAQAGPTLLQRVLHRLGVALQARRQRGRDAALHAAMQELDARTLRDIGLPSSFVDAASARQDALQAEREALRLGGSGFQSRYW